MSTIEILLTIVLAAFGLNFALLYIIWTSLKTELQHLKDDICDLRKDVHDIDRRLCRMEGIITAKDWCHLKNEGNLKKAE